MLAAAMSMEHRIGLSIESVAATSASSGSPVESSGSGPMSASPCTRGSLSSGSTVGTGVSVTGPRECVASSPGRVVGFPLTCSGMAIRSGQGTMLTVACTSSVLPIFPGRC